MVRDGSWVLGTSFVREKRRFCCAKIENGGPPIGVLSALFTPNLLVPTHKRRWIMSGFEKRNAP